MFSRGLMCIIEAGNVGSCEYFFQSDHPWAMCDIVQVTSQ